jgi:hypothetical protein
MTLCRWPGFCSTWSEPRAGRPMAEASTVAAVGTTFSPFS